MALADPKNFEHRACAVCGATTDYEASGRCKQTRDETGEYNCPGGAEEQSYPDGRLRFLSLSGYAALEAEIEAIMAGEDGEGR